MRIINKILYTCIIMLVFMTSINTVEAQALSDGVYVAPVTVDYRNPETGQIEDGGSEQNYQLGLSMCQSITNSQALIEVQNGKTYVTLRFSLMSNISSVNIATQSSSGGSYYNTSVTKLNANGDNADFKFEVRDPSFYISPSMYVTPMGRNVKFFVKINVGSAVSGSGDFTTSITTGNNNTTNVATSNNSNNTQGTINNATTNSSSNVTNTEEVSNNSEIETNEVEEEAEDIKVESQEINLDDEEGLVEEDIEEEDIEDDDTSKKETKEVSKEKKSSKSILIISAVVIVVIAISVAGFIFYRKKKLEVN